jgi:hypothetical protein
MIGIQRRELHSQLNGKWSGKENVNEEEQDRRVQGEISTVAQARLYQACTDRFQQRLI